MPERRLRPGILTSDRVDLLDYGAEVFYRRLMSAVDDYGRYDARPVILKAALYPLRLERVREADIARWIAMCEKAGLIALYEVDSKSYLVLHNLRDQRALYSKYPPPPGCKDGPVKKPAHTCAQTGANAPPTPSPTPTPTPPQPPQRGGSGIAARERQPRMSRGDRALREMKAKIGAHHE